MKREVQWPNDEEFKKMQDNFALFHNWDFEDMVCVIDGTEIRVSRPNGWEKQKRFWSSKKSQHSVNILCITALNGLILYCSDYRVGSNDQAFWNELGLRERFVDRPYGIAGDAGFTFNTERHSEKIIGYKPYKKPPHGSLTEEQKLYNKRLSQMRVVVENTFCRLKKWRVLKGVFRHLKGEKGQLDLNNIVHVIAGLTNRDIKKNPIRENRWMAPEWQEMFELHEE